MWLCIWIYVTTINKFLNDYDWKMQQMMIEWVIPPYCYNEFVKTLDFLLNVVYNVFHNKMRWWFCFGAINVFDWELSCVDSFKKFNCDGQPRMKKIKCLVNSKLYELIRFTFCGPMNLILNFFVSYFNFEVNKLIKKVSLNWTLDGVIEEQ